MGGPASGKADFTEAMIAAGHGKFQYAVFMSAAVAYFSSGLQSAVNGYIMPSIKCEFSLSAAELGVLNTAFLAAGAVTGQLWGALSDTVGRRPVLVVSVLLDALFTLAAALSPTFHIFLVFRMLSGMMNTAPAGLSFLYLGEFISEKKRSPFLAVLGVAWTTACILLPAMAWVVIPQPWAVWVFGVRLGSWRIFLAMLLVPNLCSAALALHLPETPRFLHSTGREEAALAVFRRIFTANTGASANEYPVKQLHVPSCASDSPDAGRMGPLAVLRGMARTLKRSVLLFKPPVLYRTASCSTTYFCNMFLLYGFGFWLPELLNQYALFGDAHPDQSVTICQVIGTGELPAQNETLDCRSSSIINPAVFIDTFIFNSASVVIYLACSFTRYCLGRRTVCAVVNISAGAVAFALLYATSRLELIVIASLFTGLGDKGCFAINSLLVDIFPPHVSGAGVASVMLAGRMGGAVANIIIGYLVEVSCEVPLILLCCVGIVCGLLTCCVQRPWDASQPKVMSSPVA